MRPGAPWSGRVAASAGLLLVMAATFGVAWARQRSGTSSQAGAAAVRDMESAHAAAGVETSDLGAVQSSFHENVEALREEVRANPDDAGRVLSLAHLLHDGHQSAEAVEYYEAAIEIDPSGGQAYYDLALAYADQGSWQDAARVLRRRLAIAPDDPMALYDLGAVLANLGDRDGARTLWTTLLSSPSPIEPDLRQRAEGALARLGGMDPP
jgi:cytochrome c-type biogenesis protein CcmH